MAVALKGHSLSEGACYRSDSARDMVAINLLQVAYKLFSQTTIMQNLGKLEAHYNSKGLDPVSDIREFSKLVWSLDPPFLDAFRMATCFENMFKAELLICGHVVHEINRGGQEPQRSLRMEQSNRPIKLGEIKSIEGLNWKREGDFEIESLKNKTLGFSRLIDKRGRYKNSLRLSNTCIDAITRIRRQRNTVHFLPVDIGSWNKGIVESYIYLRLFLNKRLINRHNKIVQRYSYLKTDPTYKLNEI